jgi:hypothetical protein
MQPYFVFQPLVSPIDQCRWSSAKNNPNQSTPTKNPIQRHWIADRSPTVLGLKPSGTVEFRIHLALWYVLAQLYHRKDFRFFFGDTILNILFHLSRSFANCFQPAASDLSIS